MRPVGVGTLQLEITDEITRVLASIISRHVATYPDYSIEVEVDAPGGDWNASVEIFYALKNHARRVTAHIQKASSGGALVVMAADVRRLDLTGHFFLHRPAGPCSKAILDKIADDKARLMASGCRVPAARIRRWMEETTVIGAEHALAYGLVDEVPGLPKPRNVMVFL